MPRFRDCSIRTKLSILLGVSAALALIVACLGFVINDIATFRSSAGSHLSAIADV